MSCACAGVVPALGTASKFIIADSADRNALVVVAYAISKYLDWHDRTATIFADGAGALVPQANGDRLNRFSDAKEGLPSPFPRHLLPGVNFLIRDGEPTGILNGQIVRVAAFDFSQFTARLRPSSKLSPYRANKQANLIICGGSAENYLE